MQKKPRKNLLIQRLNYIRDKQNDIYQKILNDEMKVDIQETLKMSIKDENNQLKPFRRDQLQIMKKSQNKPELVIEQINTHLKQLYTRECYCLEIKKRVKKLIKTGDFCDLNINWVLLELSGARVIKLQNRGVFLKLLEQKDKYPPELFEPIYLDSVRTLNHLDSIKKKQIEKQIETVLIAYSIRNPEIGYCQGQNFIVNYLINTLKFDLEDAFWTFTQILETIMPIDYYTNILSALTDQQILDYYIQEYIPELKTHFHKINLQSDFFTVQWYLCIFTNQVKPQLTNFIMLMLFIDGIKSLTISALILLILLKNELLKFDQFSKLYRFIFYQLMQLIIYSNIQIYIVMLKYLNITISKSKLKKKPLILLEKKLELNQFHQNAITEKQQIEIEKIPPCPKDQQVCNQVLLSNQFLRKSSSFYVYKHKDPPVMIRNYWDGNIFPEIQKSHELVILRQEHICIRKSSL
ncbi:unnamed protein product [Paramecium pentaurelia]|uniref:Rab-GAP TBC domain-containing protein n=1 Tax=Paramecium pentaurelia TaxID=43138 RepID=A0A8S1WR15_9CILI|nr:unnamed protein product [Paramecium pentaurelia]